MVPRLRAQPQLVPAITLGADVRPGVGVFAFVGTNPTDRPKAIRSKWRSGVSASGRCAFRTELAWLSQTSVADEMREEHRRRVLCK